MLICAKTLFTRVPDALFHKEHTPKFVLKHFTHINVGICIDYALRVYIRDVLTAVTRIINTDSSRVFRGRVREFRFLK